MPKLTAVLIGCGAIAREHLKALKKISGVSVEAVCDLSPARAESTADRFGVARWGTDFKKLVEECRPSLVHITTPPSSHFSIASTCLAGGLSVLCEKPITSTYDDYKSLRSLADRNGCLLIENQNLRCHSSVIKALELLKSGKVGSLVDVQIFFSLPLVGTGSPYADQNTPHFSKSMPGGAIGDFLPHISYLSELFAGEIQDVYALWQKRAQSSLPADEFRALLKGEKAPVFIAFSGTSNLVGYWIRVTGTEMFIEANLLEPPRVVIRRHRTGEPALMSVFDGMMESRAVFSGTLKAFGRKLADTSSYDGLEEFIRRVYGAISGQNELPTSPAAIDASVRLVEQLALKSQAA
jgi:predicted dehydrogenase